MKSVHPKYFHYKTFLKLVENTEDPMITKILRNNNLIQNKFQQNRAPPHYFAPVPFLDKFPAKWIGQRDSSNYPT